MKNITKILGAGALVLAGLTGCVKSQMEVQEPQIRVQEQTKIIQASYNEFNNFKTIMLTDYSGGNPDITTLDMDGDGDIDIIAAYRGRIFLFENKIPQKNKK